MAVTLKLVRQGRTGTLADSMDAEYRAAVRLVVSHRPSPSFKHVEW